MIASLCAKDVSDAEDTARSLATFSRGTENFQPSLGFFKNFGDKQSRKLWVMGSGPQSSRARGLRDPKEGYVVSLCLPVSPC